MILKNFKSNFRFYKAIRKSIMSVMVQPRFVNKWEVDVAKDSIEDLLRNHQVVLASGSPRRKEILQILCTHLTIRPSTFEENLDVKDFDNTTEFVKETAKRKALDVADILKAENVITDLIISADTIVQYENEIFGKPKTKDNAINMLNRLNGKTHQVISGVTLICPLVKNPDNNGPFIHSFHDVTDVTMADMTPETIKQYVETGEPMDKAGGYGIQGKGGDLIKTVCGDYFNVVGFPILRFHENLTNLHKQKVV